MSRLADLNRFYAILEALDRRVGGARRLGDTTGGMGWPSHGVYFFFEPGEVRSDSGAGSRVVRVGTHALRPGSATLWSRLSAHRGAADGGGGNHRGSIFRLLVGEALLRRDGAPQGSWGVGQSATGAAEKLAGDSASIKLAERGTEKATSAHLGEMHFLWVRTPPDAFELRAKIERGSVALLSNLNRTAADAPSPGWLGLRSGRAPVRGSGLWNNDYVDETHHPSFLGLFEKAALSTPPLVSNTLTRSPAEFLATEPAAPVQATCLFCQRVAEGHAALMREGAAAFPDAFPLSKGHTLVVPTRHTASYFDLTSVELGAIWSLVSEVKARLERDHRPDGFNVGINVGEAAGQTVGHAHVHVIPRYRGDAEDPRGGVRWVLPEKAPYWRGQGS